MAAISSSAIQIVVDAANHPVTGWRSTTLAPHATIITATARVTRLSER